MAGIVNDAGLSIEEFKKVSLFVIEYVTDGFVSTFYLKFGIYIVNVVLHSFFFNTKSIGNLFIALSQRK
jgi:hypothetical protein